MASWILSAMLCAVVGGNSDCTVVHFTAAWCEPCKQLEPALQQLRQEGWTIETVDTDRQPEIVQQFQVQNLPTLAILCRGQEVDRMVGAAPYERIAERVQRAAARNQNSPAVSQVAASHLPVTQSTASPVAASQSQVATQSPQPIVRGQSPELSGYPLLAANDRNSATRFASNNDWAASNPVAASAAGGAPAVGSSAAQLGATPTAATASGSSQPTSSQPTLSPEQAIARAAAATVRIRVDEANTTAYGTGTIIDVRGQEALILTCGHLFRDMQPNSQLTIDLFPGTPQEVNLPSELIDFKADQEDIGLISFRIPVAIEPIPILGRGQQVAVGQPAFSFGCDRGANPTRRDTQIKSINRYLGADNIEIVGAPVVGRSGGGLFDIQGRLIGVCNAANAQDDEGIYASAEVVFTQIERLGLGELFDDGQPVGTSQLASSSTAGSSPNSQAAVVSDPVVSDPVANNPAANGPVANATVQLASSTAPSAAPSSAQGWQRSGGQPNPQTSAAGDTLHWPDQSASVPGLTGSDPDHDSAAPLAAAGSSAGSSAAARAAGGAAGTAAGRAPGNASNIQQVICIVRNSSGQDQVVTIDAPPQQLLQLIQQSQSR